MTTINWHPSPGELRRWALLMAPALGAVGSVFYFVEWGIFTGGQGVAKFLWGFGAVSLVTGLTGTRLGLPAYWAWMGFVYVVLAVITTVSLSLVYFLVVTPLALLGRVIGRDRLQLRRRGAATYWHALDTSRSRDLERPF